ncbi:serine/threonine protein kinase [Candidatus Uhrbacteria bacterium]|nr:serine/threonine protein kinase [Candidatus Uhrbacteria bacterium]
MGETRAGIQRGYTQHREVPEEAHETAPKTVEIKVGAELTDSNGNKYEILEKLGQGGLGSVFKVKDKRLDQVRALKVLNTKERAESNSVKRFKREIHLLGQMNNPFILTAYDVAEFEVEGEKVIGLITDYVKGDSLAKNIKERGRIFPNRAVSFASEIAIALGSLEEANVVHRDIKPDNVLIKKLSDGTEMALLADFGVAALTEEARVDVFRNAPEDANVEWAEAITQKGNVVGTLQYMAPEQFKRNTPDHRSDLYSFGMTLYAMATGTRPFNAKSMSDIIISAQMDIPPSFKERGVEDVPEWFEDIVMKLLEKKPNDRFQTAAEVYRALREGVEKDYPEMLNEIPFIWNVFPNPKPKT